MVRVTIELLPLGSEERKELLGIVEIANDGTGSVGLSSYDVVLMKAAKFTDRPGVWRRGKVRDFPRQRLGPYDLLYRALAACVGSRNRGVG